MTDELNDFYRLKADRVTVCEHGSQRCKCLVCEREAELADLRAAVKLMEHKVITCGVAATNPDANLTLRADYMKWDSPQAEAVRALRKERDDIRAAVAHAAVQLEAAEAKTGDAPESARAHFREAIRTIARTLPPSEVKFDRAAVWGELREMDRLHAALAEACYLIRMFFVTRDPVEVERVEAFLEKHKEKP